MKKQQQATTPRDENFKARDDKNDKGMKAGKKRIGGTER
jgi:hypothetical protein